MTRQEAIKKAVGAHGQWKTRLKAAIESGKSEFSVETVSQDDNCEFGKWLYGDPKLKIETPTHFEKVRQLHAEFHREVSRVLELALGNKKQEALSAFDTNTRFTRLSAELTMEMLSWSKV